MTNIPQNQARANPVARPRSELEAIKVLFVIQDHFSLLAFTAAVDALATANLVLGQARFVFQAIGLQSAPTTSDVGIQISTDYHVTSNGQLHDGQEQVELSAHIIIICGGYRCDLNEHLAMSKLLTRADSAGMTIGALWNGSVALAHARLLHGYACTLHPDNYLEMTKRFPELDIRTEAMVVDRDRLSAAGPNSAFDLMLHLVLRYDTGETVQAIRNILKADSASESTLLSDQHINRDQPLPDKIKRALQLMKSNLHEPLGRSDIAAHLNMSTRALERLFEKHLNTSPARQYMDLRLLKAHTLLRQTDRSVSAIAQSCGFVSSAHFSRTFSKRFSCTPMSLRRDVRPRIM